MEFAIITNFSFEKFEIDEWLPLDENEYHIFLRKKFNEESKSRNFSKNVVLHFINDWNSCELEYKIIELHKTLKFNKIFCFREEDVVRTAKLRDILNIPGQKEDAALLYRDKLKMKEHLEKFGIPVAKNRGVNDYVDCLKAIEEFDFPVVLKPRMGLGSADTFVIDNNNELYKVAKEVDLSNYIIEKYIEGDVYHVDVLVTDYQVRYISAAKYVNNCLAYKKGKSTASVFLPNSTSKSKSMTSFAKKVLFSLPKEKDNIYHIELFDSNDGIVLCEIACRAGGAQIVPIVDRCYGVNLFKEYLYSQIGLSELSQQEEKGATLSKGYLLISPQVGTLIDFPSKIDLPFIEAFEIYASKGQTYEKLNSSVFALASFEVGGDSAKEVEDNLKLLEKKFKAGVIYKEV
ncbi:MAG TPA: ATP-grasp domain-containing protein [Candidatus Coprosoma intestinipullorum]|uniref:ATP-grasp domain-containing protein n=1 Tax=Candidatus Coprosoma intestinipullorum TaxID=2840752 RepID=A0A9D1CYN1_9FIRM|nr:ATP-grasp domain-containing protein [Candidatus Coprosoma intestinipullorum]